MAALRHSLLLCMFVSGCYASQPETAITNNLSNCIEIKNSVISLKDSIPVLKIQYKEIKRTSECGCKSMISTYKSHAILNGHSSLLIGGQVLLTGKQNVEIPIATDKRLIGQAKVNLTLSCALPS